MGVGSLVRSLYKLMMINNEYVNYILMMITNSMAIAYKKPLLLIT
jgi:hypothetical protein